MTEKSSRSVTCPAGAGAGAGTAGLSWKSPQPRCSAGQEAARHRQVCVRPERRAGAGLVGKKATRGAGRPPLLSPGWPLSEDHVRWLGGCQSRDPARAASRSRPDARGRRAGPGAGGGGVEVLSCSKEPRPALPADLPPPPQAPAANRVSDSSPGTSPGSTLTPGRRRAVGTHSLSLPTQTQLLTPLAP